MKLLKAFFGLCAVVGFFVLACAASTLDYPGSIAVSDGQLFIAAILGAVMCFAGIGGMKSLEEGRK